MSRQTVDPIQHPVRVASIIRQCERGDNMKFTTILAAVIVTAAIMIAWGVSAAANFYFGASLGTHAPFNAIFFETTTSDLFSWASVAADLLKALCLFLVLVAVANRQYGQATALATIWALCTFWSFNSAVGFVALNHSTVTDNRGKTADNWTELKDEIARKQERRKWIPVHRPAATVKAEIIGQEGQYLFARTKQCSTISAPESVTFCNGLGKLRQEFFNAEEAAKLDGELDSLRGEMKKSDKVSSADPYAELLAAVTGTTFSQATNGRALFFAIMIEVISAFGISAVWEVTLKRRQKPQEAPQASDGVKVVSIAVAPAITLPVATEDGPGSGGGDRTPGKTEGYPPKLVDKDPRFSDAQKIKPGSKAERLEAVDVVTNRWLATGNAVRVNLSLGSRGIDIYNAYSDFCASYGIKPVNPSHFGRSLRRLKVAFVKKAGGIRYGLKLVKHQRAVAAIAA